MPTASGGSSWPPWLGVHEAACGGGVEDVLHSLTRGQMCPRPSAHTVPLSWPSSPKKHLPRASEQKQIPGPQPVFPGIGLCSLGTGKGSQPPRGPRKTHSQTLSTFLSQKAWANFVSPDGVCWGREVVVLLLCFKIRFLGHTAYY